MKESKKLISEIDGMINIVRGWAGKCSNKLAEYMTNIGTMSQLRILRV